MKHLHDGLVSHTYSCPLNHIYNYNRVKECHRYVNPPTQYCPNITCNNASSTYAIVFPRDAQYYYFCIADKFNRSLQPVMFKCDSGWIFNGQKCVYNCQKEGRYAVLDDKTSYYACRIISGKYEVKIQKCPIWFEFSESLGYCQSKLIDCLKIKK